MSKIDALEKLRTCIDEIDNGLLDLLNQRAQYAKEIAKVKKEISPNPSFYCPEREAELLKRLAEINQTNQGILREQEITKVFREIMSVCLALEQELEIGFLGPQGTFTHEAALKHFGHSAQLKSLDSIDEVFREAESGSVAYGVVPVENSTEGSVHNTLDCLMDSTLMIVGELELRIHHCLVGCGDDISCIKTVYSHHQPFQQCRRWFALHLPNCKQIIVNSTAEAAQHVKENADTAVIASAAVAGLYGLQVIKKNIEDEPSNTTRFLIIGDHKVPSSGNDKTSILISTRNRPGALVHLLQPLSESGVSMTRIESRPARQANWQYVFFIDIDGHLEAEAVKSALLLLEKEAGFFKLLGAYPKSSK